MKKLQKGDKVKTKGWSWDTLRHYGLSGEETYTVTEYYDDAAYPSFRFEGSSVKWDALSFELVATAPHSLKAGKDSVKKLEVKPEEAPEYTGGSSNYYKVFVRYPTTLTEPYEAECNDIIEALKMTFAEGNAFKAIWRKAKARQGVQKKGYDNGLYDSEKVVFFGERMVVEAKSGADK